MKNKINVDSVNRGTDSLISENYTLKQEIREILKVYSENPISSRALHDCICENYERLMELSK